MLYYFIFQIFSGETSIPGRGWGKKARAVFELSSFENRLWSLQYNHVLILGKVLPFGIKYVYWIRCNRSLVYFDLNETNNK